MKSHRGSRRSIRLAEFSPLVRDSLALHCGLKILYVRKEEPRNLIYQGGDLDNKLNAFRRFVGS